MQSAGEKYAPPQNFFGGYYTNSGQVCKAFSPRESNFLCKFADFSHKIEKAEKLPPFAVRIFRPAGSLFRVGVGEDQIVDERIGEGLRILTDQLDSKNFYAFNPAFDMPCKASCKDGSFKN